jgi:rhodanese-related sulfurtransferase
MDVTDDGLRITLDELIERLQSGDDVVFLDTRNPHAWATSAEKLPAALRMRVDDVERLAVALPRGRPIVTYCT